ncbi:uncharacterized protein LOC104444255 [Eucalyptus grandis]|uniref:Uncharacterized protein n=2 Tax=Eucalyptus grandis TaxID=71139 RepID=A0ACC3KUQ3_EUCGR|nr:uncharacterized protein LOC104444255 [Eucalyptus grandis]KAK3429769.1 hypothetical protein EUGRSUZ_E01257 [Eucalyptus grandis]
MADSAADGGNSRGSSGGTSIGKVLATTDARGGSGGGGGGGGVGLQIERARDPYGAYDAEEKPSKVEVWGWHLYGFCTYFIETALIPIVFPLIISQVVGAPPAPSQGWTKSHKGMTCREKEMRLFVGLTHRSTNEANISPLEWTAVCWFIGLVLAAPLLNFVSMRLDHGQYQQLIAGAATVVGAIFCLPAGFFRTPWIFLPYIVVIVAASLVSSAAHTRNLGLMIRGFSGPLLKKSQFHVRRSVSGWLSLYATAAGCFGAALISAFSYHMLDQKDRFISLWVVSIFGGLFWLLGILYVIVAYRPGPESPPPPFTYIISIFSYPHAVGSLVGVFLSSFTTMCIFTGAVLFLVGELCLKPVFVLYFWLTYFLFPLVSLPLLHPLQNLIKANAVKMQLLGFLLSMITCGVGFYYRNKTWNKGHVIFFATLQSTAAGILYAYGRILVLDCAPSGKEGAFSVWYSWVKVLGTCAGFGIASVVPRSVSTSFGIAFICAILGAVMFVFGNVSDLGGALAAGNVREDDEKGSPRRGMVKNPLHLEGP